MAIALAGTNAVGLISALLGDGIWDVMSWIMLAAPTVVVGWHLARPFLRTLSSG